MSQSPPSYWRDTASASPGSPVEGDFFSPRQLCDNQESLEEQETCDDHTDPIVHIVPDNFPSFLQNAQTCAPPAANDLGKECVGGLPQEQPIEKSQWREPRSLVSTSPIEKMFPIFDLTEVRGLDGRFIILVSTHTQTDWEWVERSLAISCQVQKEIEDSQLLQADDVSTDPDFSEAASLKQGSKDKSVPCCVLLPRLIQAYKPEPKQTPHAGKVPEVESKQYVHLAQCDYCRQLCQPFKHSEQLGNERDCERLFCCERAKQMGMLILEEREKLAQEELDRKIDVNPHAPVMSKEEREAAKEQAHKRLRHLQPQKRPRKENLNMNDSSNVETKHKTSLRQFKVPDTTPIKKSMETREDETDGEPKSQPSQLKEVMLKSYKNGTCFLTLCPDGTGNVYYPSGKAAIIISSAEAADFTYIIMEDKDVEPRIKGIFTKKGHSTCYHHNGMIWLNLTPVGGHCFSETGTLRRRWNWLYLDPHVRNLPFKPLILALGPHISVRIHSRDDMYITFAHQQNSVRFSVGSVLKLVYQENHDKPEQDVLERYIQVKSAEIYSLLGQMQTYMSHHSANLSNIKPHYSFTAETQRLSRQMEKEKSSEKTKAHSN